MRILSFGGGVQTTALAVLWAQGKVEADACVFSDTGGETPETYAHIDAVDAWLRKTGGCYHIERVAFNGPTLEDYVLTRSTPIPVRFRSGGMQNRQCTSKWKIDPVKRWARQHGAKTATMLMGISVDEVHRAKDAREKWITREFPLLDMRLTRQDCIAINESVGFANVPKSACFYCPFQPSKFWLRLHREHPDLFARAEAMETAINTRTGGSRAYISGMVPLRQAGKVDQGSLFDEECEGVCFV